MPFNFMRNYEAPKEEPLGNWYSRIYNSVKDGINGAHNDLMGQLPPPPQPSTPNYAQTLSSSGKNTQELNNAEQQRVSQGNPNATPVDPNAPQPPKLAAPNWKTGEASLGGQYPMFTPDGKLQIPLRGKNYDDPEDANGNPISQAAPQAVTPPEGANVINPYLNTGAPQAAPAPASTNGMPAHANGYIQSFRDFMLGKRIPEGVDPNSSAAWLGRKPSFLQVLGDALAHAGGDNTNFQGYAKDQYDQRFNRENELFKNGETKRLNDTNIANTNATTEGINISNKYIAPMNDAKLAEAGYNNQLLGARAKYSDQLASNEVNQGAAGVDATRAGIDATRAGIEATKASTAGQLIDNQYKPQTYDDAHKTSVQNIETSKINNAAPQSISTLDNGESVGVLTVGKDGKSTLTPIDKSSLAAQNGFKLEQIKAKAKQAGLPANAIKEDGSIDWTGYPAATVDYFNKTGKLPEGYKTGELFPYTAKTTPQEYKRLYAAKHPGDIEKMAAVGTFINELNRMYDLTSEYERRYGKDLLGRIVPDAAANQLMHEIQAVQKNLPQLAKRANKIKGDNMSNLDVEVVLQGMPMYNGKSFWQNGGAVRAKAVEASRIASAAFQASDNEYGALARAFGVNIPEQFITKNTYITPRMAQAIKARKKGN